MDTGLGFTQGEVLLGKYRVEALLGIGGMGRVIKASHQYLNQSFAIKILLPSLTDSQSTVQRFLREAQAAVRLRSEHTARVVDVGTLADGAPYMVMEYLEGNDLNQILRHHGPQQPNIVVDLMLQACEGLAEAHAIGIVHRDVKPSNFFITRRPDGSMLLKILDFGISKTSVAMDDLTGTQTVLGTPSYMAPEQMRSGRHANAQSDVWSMGVVMYQLLQGALPFGGETYAELVLAVNSDPPSPLRFPLPGGMAEVILRCLQKDPKQRIQSVGELAQLIAPYASDPIAASQVAGRTLRTLQTRASQDHVGRDGNLMVNGGNLATPVPISPAHMTPRSWAPSSTSLSQGKGQVTYQVGSNRGWWVAGVLSLVILAGAGGFIVNNMTKAASTTTAAAPIAPVIAPVAAPPVVDTKPVEPPPVVVAPPQPTETAGWKPTSTTPTVPEAGSGSGSAAPVVEATPAATLVDQKPVAAKAKATPRPRVKTPPKPKAPKKPTSDGLFDSRK